MDPSKSLDHFASRRDLLRGYLQEYTLLAQEHPELAELLSFDGFVEFSFAYYCVAEQAEGTERLIRELTRVRSQLPLPIPKNLLIK